MIPKVIHYIWLSNEAMPYINRRCVKSCKEILKDYKIKFWTMKDFDINNMKYVKEAIECKKWAFATDYLRMYVLYHEGGIYMDTDILVLKNFEPFMDNRFFSFIEYHHDSIVPVIQAAFMGAEKEHPLPLSVLNYYDNTRFIDENGEYSTKLLAPDVYANEAHLFGFQDVCKEQICEEGIHIYGSDLVAGAFHERNDKNYAIHMCAGSWRDYKASSKFKIRMRSNITLFKFLHRNNNQH